MYAALHGTVLAVVTSVQWQQVHTVNISSYFDIFWCLLTNEFYTMVKEDHTRAYG
jgi:hypothetical protein